MNIIFRPIVATDSEALRHISSAAPDTGRIQISPDYHLDTYESLLSTDPDNTSGFIAIQQHPQENAVGSGWATSGHGQFNQQEHPYTLLHNLVVHPEHRNQGIASQLARKRIENAQQTTPDSLILAFIQQGNISSLTAAQKWSAHLVGALNSGVTPMRSRPPRQQKGVVIRSPEPSEFAKIAGQLDTFYADHDLYTPHTADTLTKWLAQSPFETPYHHYRIAIDNNGQIVAGLAVIEQYRVKSMHIQHMPRAIYWLNKIIKLLPSNNRLKPLSVTKGWFAKDQQQAAQFLWETIRWEWRQKANVIFFMTDPRCPLNDMIQAPFWMPRSQFHLACSRDDILTGKRPIYTL